MTTSERMARIDRQFDISFGVFDDQMRAEQGAIAGQRNGSGGSGGGAGAENSAGGDAAGGDGGSGEGGESGQNGSGQNGQGGSGNGQGPGGDGQSQGQGKGSQGGGGFGGGAKGGSGPSTVPADIPDGSDDDVVARQLREAAMAETDPELREKLWEEYRNYKKGAG